MNAIGIVEVMDRKAYSHILVSDDIDVTLIGSVTLKTLGLEVDPVTGRLKEARIYLL
jgi:predicted aspartyl protease